MEIIASIFSVIFIGLVLATALTLGMALFLWIIGIGVVMAVLIMLRETWRRWWFVHNASKPEPPRVIEGEYKDISED